ncbi:MAG: HD domain-containing protein [Cyanobacteria bacterium SZAS TMP-1]|nr:HD domain-containing protein [Cyanobacteria bacterium SZAS TMP-1]
MTHTHDSKDRAIGTAIAMQLQRAGFIAVFAGGCVRDYFLGLEPKDFDIATNATPEQIIKVFEGDTVLLVGAQFGIIIVVRDGVQIEIATLRTDGQYADGRRPDQVSFVTGADPMVSLKEDASRRDLTVNAMYQDPVSGKIFDFFGGRNDIAARLLRTVGLPSERFSEDRLRMLRVARFAGKLGFNVADELRAALIAHAADLKPGLVVSWERVAKELEGMLTSKHPLVCLDLLVETGLMAEILPEMMDTLHPLAGRQDPIWHPEGLVWTHTKMVLAELVAHGASFELLLAGLLHDVSKPETLEVEVVEGVERIHNYGHAEKGAVVAEAVCKRLKLSSKQVFRVSEIVRLHMQMHSFGEPGIKRSKLVRLMERDDIMDLIMMQHADSMGTGRTQEQRESASHKAFYLAKLDEVRNDPNPALRPGAVILVDGKMIKELGFKPGPIYKVIKEAAFEAQHAGEFTDEASARQWLHARAEEFRACKPETESREPVASGKRCC